MHLTDKVVIVTGGGDGIGLAAARAYASLGAHVLITGRRAERLEAIHANERRIHGLVADVGDPADAPRTVEKVLDLWGRIDILVNNAGAGAPLPLADATAERLRSIYAVNTIGPTLLAAAVIPHLERSKGVIVNLSSSLARKAVPGFSRGVPEEVARWIVALTAGDADWVTGQILGVDGGFALV